MKKKSLYALALACLIGMTSCHKDQNNQQQAETPYASMTLKQQNCTLNASYTASIRGQQDINIMPQVSGTLVRLCVKEGQEVHAGQVLFVIDQVPYRAAVQAAEANVQAAEAQVATAQLTYDSRVDLQKQNVISEYDLKVARNNLLSAKAALAQAQAALVNARNNLSYTEVKAPSYGVVGTLPYRIGSLVSPQMQQPLTVVSDNSQMYVYFSMDEKEYLRLVRQYGSKDNALLHLPAVKLQLVDGTEYDQLGDIETIAGIVDASTGSISLRAAFQNNGGLLSGLTGNIIIPTERTGVILIPQAATYEVQDKVFAYTYSDGKAHARAIQVTRVGDGKQYIVESGLKAGDVLITEGVGMLKDGQAIKIKKS